MSNQSIVGPMLENKYAHDGCPYQERNHIGRCEEESPRRAPVRQYFKSQFGISIRSDKMADNCLAQCDLHVYKAVKPAHAAGIWSFSLFEIGTYTPPPIYGSKRVNQPCSIQEAGHFFPASSQSPYIVKPHINHLQWGGAVQVSPIRRC